MDDLRNWLINAEDYRNNFLENVQAIFSAIVSKYNPKLICKKQDKHIGGNEWSLNGKLLLSEVEAQLKDNRNQLDKIKLVLDDECFEGHLDTDGHGFGVLKKSKRAL